MRTKERIAWHEAGHVLARVKLKHRFEIVTIKSRGDYLGAVLGGEAIEGPAINALSDYCVICYSGHAAEELYTGLSLPIDMRQSDFQEAREQMEKYIPDTHHRAAFADTIYTAARVTLKAFRPQVKALANELLKKGTLTYEECRAIIGE